MAAREQSNKEKLRESYSNAVKTFLNNSDDCKWNDVTFVIGDEGREFHAMKGLFAMHSPVFKFCVCVHIV